MVPDFRGKLSYIPEMIVDSDRWRCRRRMFTCDSDRTGTEGPYRLLSWTPLVCEQICFQPLLITCPNRLPLIKVVTCMS